MLDERPPAAEKRAGGFAFWMGAERANAARPRHSRHRQQTTSNGGRRFIGRERSSFAMRFRFPPIVPSGLAMLFPFRLDNRKPDGSWDAPDATEDNIKGTSVDPHEPMWPRWRQTPPPEGEGEFVSEEPFFDIDEITQKAVFYPPGRPLVDKNVDGNPGSRQRVGDTLTGNLWRRRLLVGSLNRDPQVPNERHTFQDFESAAGIGDTLQQRSDALPWRTFRPTATSGPYTEEHAVRLAAAPFSGAPTPSNSAAQSKGPATAAPAAPIRGSMSGTTATYEYPDGSQDVRTGGTRTWRTNNPGAMEYGNFAKSHGAIGTDGRFAIFPDEATGTAALDALLRTQRYQQMSIDQTIATYAPPHENNTAAYQAYVARRLGVPRTTPVSQLSPAQMVILRDAIRTFEGWQPGTSKRSGGQP
jgi:hypothetical protein